MTDNDEWNRKIIDEFRANAGKVGGPFEGMALLLLHHRGARTGIERLNPLGYGQEGDDPVIFASNGGAARTPDWYHNVRANPDVEVEVGADRWRARARVTSGKERERIWSAQKEAISGLAEKEHKTTREIPVVVLERV